MELRNNTDNHMVLVELTSGEVEVHYHYSLMYFRHVGMCIDIVCPLLARTTKTYDTSSVKKIYRASPMGDLIEIYSLFPGKSIVSQPSGKEDVWVVTVYMDGLVEPEVIEFQEKPGVCDEDVAFVTFADGEKQSHFKADKVNRFFVSRKEG